MKAFLSISCRTEQNTAEFGAQLASTLVPGDCLTLSGPLGAGKTALVRAIVRALCGNAELDVPSPTFTLVQYYDGPPPIAHADLYRTEHPEEWDELGLDDVLAAGIVLIEWPDRAGDRLPRHRLDIVGEPMPDNTRVWSLSGDADWQARLRVRKPE